MNRSKKFLLNILLPLFAGIVVFAVGLIMHNSQAELSAYAQESYGSDTLAVLENSSYVVADTSTSDYSSNYSLRAFIGSDYASSLGTSVWTTEQYEDTGHGKMAVLQKRLIGHIMALRTKELSGYAGSSYSSVNFQSLFTVYEFDSSLFPDYSYVSAKFATNDVDKDTSYYYFVAVVIETEYRDKRTSTQWEYSSSYKFLKKSEYIHKSVKELAYDTLQSDLYDTPTLDLSSSPTVYRLQCIRKAAGLPYENKNFNISFKYRNVTNTNAQNDGAIPWHTDNYQAETLASMSKSYLFSKILNLRQESLSDFNVIRSEIGYNVSSPDSTYLKDEYTLLEAAGYDYTYDGAKNEGVFTITYDPFKAKDFTVVVTTNDSAHSSIYLRSGNIVTKNGITTITFDTSNVKTRLSNNFNWNVENTDFNNYVIYNPYESDGRVTITKTVSDGNVVALTVSTSDTNLLADCMARLEIEVVPPVELTVTVRYKELHYDNGNFTETDLSKVLSEKIWSYNYTKIDKTAFLNGDTGIGISAQGDFIKGKIAVTDNNGNAIERLTFSDIALGTADNATATAMITVRYTKNTLFKITDNLTDTPRFVPASKQTTLTYGGSELIKIYDGYRVVNIISDNGQYAKIDTAARPDDWNNAKINILCQLSEGNIIPLKITYSDKYKVRIEHLQNYLCATKDGKQEASGVAEKKITEKEVKIDSFADIYSPTTDELKNFLGLKDLRVIGKFGAPDLEKTVVTFSDDIYTIKLSYAYAAVKVQQADGSYEEVKVPMSSYAEWTNSFGKDWSVLFLNTTEKVIFTDTASVKPENVYGYFFVSVFKEKVKNLDMLFAGYASDGCKTFYQYEEVKGSAFYKFMGNNPYLLPVVGGAVGGITGLILGHPIKGTAGGAAVGAGMYYSIMSISEMANDENGTYYSYFSFLDGTSELPYASNSRAGGFDDNDSAAKNTAEKIVDEVKDFFKNLWNSDNAITRFLKIVLGLFALYVIFSIVLKIIATIINFFRRLKK